MTIEEIIECNTLTAEFMGGIYNDSPNRRTTFSIPKDSIWLPYFNLVKVSQLKYNTSWDWLMPVVAKIYKLDMYYQYTDVESRQFYAATVELTPNIDAVYRDVIRFIMWYNENK